MQHFNLFRNFPPLLKHYSGKGMQITFKNATFIFCFKISAGNLEKITDGLLP